MNQFFKDLPLASFIQRLAESQREAADLLIDHKIDKHYLRAWVMFHLDDWITRHDYVANNYQRLIAEELQCAENETDWSIEKLTTIYNIWFTTIIDGHRALLSNTLDIAKNHGMVVTKNSGIQTRKYLLIDLLLSQSDEKFKIADDWHPDLIKQEHNLITLGGG